MSKKWTAIDVGLAGRMRAVGVPLDLKEFKEPLIIRQFRDPGVNSFSSGYLTSQCIGSVIISYVQVISAAHQLITISGFELSAPWKDVPLTLLPDPADDFSPQTYRFLGHDASQFDRSQVIPQSGTLRHGQTMEGFLLAIDYDPLPSSFTQGSVIPLRLTIADQFDRLFSKELFFSVDRTAEAKAKPKPVRRFRRLFDKRDEKEKESTVVRKDLATSLAVAKR